MPARPRIRFDSWLAIGILALAVVVRLADPGLVWSLRNDVFDAYQRWLPRPVAQAPVVVVDIDAKTLARHGPWPWPQERLAALVTGLDALGARAIALDLVLDYADPSETVQTVEARQARPAREADLATALAAAGNVVTAIAATNSSEFLAPPRVIAGLASLGDDPTPLLVPIAGARGSSPALEAGARGNGVVTFLPDRDGIVRRAPLLVRRDDRVYPALAAEAIRIAFDAPGFVVKARGASRTTGLGSQTGISDVRIGPIAAPTDPTGSLIIRFGPWRGERTIPAWRVLEGTAPAAPFADAIVIVGGSATDFGSRHATSVAASMPRSELHAQIVEQILGGYWLRRSDWADAAELVFVLVLGVIVIALTARHGALVAAVIGGGGIVAAMSLSWYAFAGHGLLFDPVFPSLVVGAVYLVSSLTGRLRAEGREKFVKHAFKSYMSPNLVEHFMANPGSLELGGERRECSFVFTDLAGFTALVEQSEPAAVARLLNDYVSEMSRIAFDHGGTLDRVVGDAVAVLFSAPVVQVDHAARAVACAVAMDRFGRAFAEAMRRQDLPLGGTRIGVNTGTVLIGNVGGAEHSDYRALGDAVNVAARLEAANKRLGTRVLVSTVTAGRCPGFVGRRVGTLLLAGKSEGVDALEPFDPDGREAPPAEYDGAFGLLDEAPAEACERFQDLAARYPEDALTRFHLARLRSGETGAVIDLRGA